MRTKPAVSVIMPVYNGEEFLKESVRSVLAQSFRDWELLIVDDGSTDGTSKLCASFSDDRIRYLRKDNGGVSSARNYGLEFAKADVICFLDADDLYSKDTLCRFVDAFTEIPQPVMVYGEARAMLHTEGKFLKQTTSAVWQRPSGEVLEAFLSRNHVATPGCMAVRRQLVHSLGGFDESLCFGEDWELYTRLAAQGLVTYLPGRELVIYRLHDASAARCLGLNPENAFPAIERAFANALKHNLLQPIRLQKLRKNRISAAYALSGTENIKAGNFVKSRRYLWRALRSRPMRAREWVLLACALAKRIPFFVRHRLK